MQIFLLVISTILVLFCFGDSPRISNTSDIILLFEHLLLLFLAKGLINYEFKTGKHLRHVYYTYFLLGYVISLFLLHFLWKPYLLKEYSTGWDAFDPVKYYALAYEMVDGKYVTDVETFPVIHIFFHEMNVFGVNPLVPFYFNSLAFLYAVITIAKYLGKNNLNHIKHYSLLLLIPESLYFNVTASKDIICLFCATIIFVHSQKIVDKKYKLSNVLILFITFAIMFLARTTMAMMAAICVFVFLLDFRKFNKMTIGFILVCILLFVFSNKIEESLGLRVTLTDISENVVNELSGDMSGANELSDQTSDAFANKLIPHNTIEFFAFGIIRSIIYAVISPSDFLRLFDFSRFTFDYTTYLNSLLMTLSWPILVFILLNKKKFADHEWRRLFIVVMIYLFAVGIFNPLIIHRRYRVVYDLLFFALVIKSLLNIHYGKEISRKNAN